MRRHRDESMLNFLLAAVVGGVIGAGVTLLMTSKTVNDLTCDLKESCEDLCEKAKDIATDLTEKGEQIVMDVCETVKNKGDELFKGEDFYNQDKFKS